MTATDGNPLTGDPDSDAVRHLLALIVPVDRAAVHERIDELIVVLGRRDGLSAAEARARSVGPGDVLAAPGPRSGRETCRICQGTGGCWTDEWLKCSMCNGTGRVAA